MLRFFEEENTEDLDELFDEVARNPQEMRSWLLLSMHRLPHVDRIAFVADVVAALWGLIAKDGYLDDEIVDDANTAVAEKIGHERRKHLARRRLPGGEMDCSTPMNYFAHRATDRDWAERHRTG